MGEMLDSRVSKAETEQGKATAYKEIGICAAIKGKNALAGIGEILRPRQEAVNLLFEGSRRGSKACPPYVPFLLPKLHSAPRAIQDPAHKRAAEAEMNRKRQIAETSFRNTGQLGLYYLRYIVGGEIAGT